MSITGSAEKLHEAVHQRDLKEVALLCEGGVHVGVGDSSGLSPLDYAAHLYITAHDGSKSQSDALAIAETLLSHGAKASSTVVGHAMGHTDTVLLRALLKHKVVAVPELLLWTRSRPGRVMPAQRVLVEKRWREDQICGGGAQLDYECPVCLSEYLSLIHI